MGTPEQNINRYLRDDNQIENTRGIRSSSSKRTLRCHEIAQGIPPQESAFDEVARKQQEAIRSGYDEKTAFQLLMQK